MRSDGLERRRGRVLMGNLGWNWSTWRFKRQFERYFDCLVQRLGLELWVLV